MADPLQPAVPLPSSSFCPLPLPLPLPPSSSTSGTSSPNNFFTSGCFSSAAGDFLNSLGVNPNSFFASSSSPGGQMLARNSTKTLKCPKCNWHYKYQETLEIHMKEKHADQEVICAFCVENQAHPKLARGETYSCGYKPYRCELCKYSTTTKGNLSIHMQSDKHLHALQDIPQSLAAAAAGSSQFGLFGSGQFGQSPIVSSAASNFDSAISSAAAAAVAGFPHPPPPPLPFTSLSANGGALQCLICLGFCTDHLEEMAAHLDRDRGQCQEGDVAALHGYFQCLLCPYSTNLKANFQLHTRTDKHLQRVQLINHLREASALLGPAEQFARLSTLKSAVQVRCQPCQEIFSCLPSIRDHCLSPGHLHRMATTSAAAVSSSSSFVQSLPLSSFDICAVAGESVEDVLSKFLWNAFFRCGKCQWEGCSHQKAFEHATLHNGGVEEGSNKNNNNNDDEEENAEDKMVGGNERALDEKERAIGWMEMDQHLIDAGEAKRTVMMKKMEKKKEDEQEEEEEKEASNTDDRQTNGDNNAHDDGATLALQTKSAVKCPLCSLEPMLDLAEHIAQQHNIPAGIAKRLAQQTTIIDESAPTPIAAIVEPKLEEANNQHCPPAAQSSPSTSMANQLALPIANPSTSISSDPVNLLIPNGTSSSPPPPSSSPLPTSSSSPSAALDSAIFRHSCSQCSLAFRTSPQLHAHSLAHSPARFRLLHRCNHMDCAAELPTAAALAEHRVEKHGESEREEEEGRRRDEAVQGKEGGGHLCDICQDGQRFDSDQALLAHFNSEGHLQRAANAMAGAPIGEEEEHLAASTATASALLSSSPSSSSNVNRHGRRSNSANGPKALPYICNVCSLAFGQPGTLDTHLRSMAHSQRMAKLADLIQSGEVDSSKPVFEQPEPHPPQRSIGEAAKGRKKQMGKLSTAPPPQKPSLESAKQQQSPQNPLEQMFKVDSQQQQMLQFMAQMFAGGGVQSPSQMPTPFTASNQMAQMAQMMLTAQMAAAQMAATNGFGLMEMLTAPKMNGLQQQTGNNNNEEEQEQEEEEEEEAAPPKAKKQRQRGPNNRAGSNTSADEQKQQKWLMNINNNNNNNNANGWNGANEQGGEAESSECSIASASESATAVAGGGLDLAAILQALASSSNPLGPPPVSSAPSAPFAFMPTSTDPNMLMAAAAAMANSAAQFPASSSSANSQSILPPPNPQQQQQQQSSNAPSPSPQKRARTRIGDEQIKILRQYFDINNSPSEEQIKEMAQRTQLGEKVIKHWFRNTLFKERQRDKDSPYNFSIPPQMGIDLATYHLTGEARIVPLVKQENIKEEESEIVETKEEEDEEAKNEEETKKENLKRIVNRTEGIDENEANDEREEMQKTTKETTQNGQKRKKMAAEHEEEEGCQQQEEGGNESPHSLNGAQEQQQLQKNDERIAAENMAAVAADFLANLGRQQFVAQQAAAAAAQSVVGSLANPFGTSGAPFDPATAAEQFAQMFAPFPAGIGGGPFGGAAGAFHSAFGATPFSNLFSSAILPPPTSASSIAPPSFSTSSHQLQNPPAPSSSSSNSAAPPVSSNNLAAQNQSSSQAQTMAAITTSASSNCGSIGSGRRANRTRFTDFQLRTLQEFFDKQAYPKDDDLEMLSKKMGLSPRVIVVWFQNARQKARKVFEQQPHLLPQQHSVEQTDSRFARTPSANFQCRACGQVFQRYLELIQHQQRVCFAAEHEKAQQQQQEQEAESSMAAELLNGVVKHWGDEEDTEEHGNQQEEEQRSIHESAQEMLLRHLVGPLQHKTESQQHQNQNNQHRQFHKRCPFCGLLFNCRDKLAAHLPQRHPEQSLEDIDIDALPFADEVPGLDLLHNIFASGSTQNGGAELNFPLDLSLNHRLNNNDESSTKPREEAPASSYRSNEASLSPTAFSSAGENEYRDSQSKSCSPLAALLPTLFQPFTSAQRPQNQASPHSLSNNSKRFRTHLTPMQVFIMKSLFHDYKTPSMQECDSLGKKIGLHKRVVQVWFQNARAKERKTASSSGSAEPEEIVPSCGSTQQCQLCADCPLTNIQEHIFGLEHIDKIREKGALLRGIGGEMDEQQQQRKESIGGNDASSASSQHPNEECCIDGGQTTPTPTMAMSTTAASLASQFGPLAQFGLNYALAAAAQGLGAGTANPSPLLYDPAIFGTPVPALKIPESVVQQILMDMAQRKEHSKFTQDGLGMPELEKKLKADDYQQAKMVDLEVGWGCAQCGNVFQQMELLQNHQKLICPGADGAIFRLVQSHYQCQCCQQRFGTQTDFGAHCQLSEHKSAAKGR